MGQVLTCNILGGLAHVTTSEFDLARRDVVGQIPDFLFLTK
jgi:hypothetical protein